jgi:small subunit ribosomal protein S5
VILGNRHGKVGLGVAKGKDVQIGVEKAVRKAKKEMIEVPIINETIPHMVSFKYKIARVVLKPAPRGTGIIAGGAVRAVLDLAGVPNVSAKILSKSKNKMTIAKATLGALQSFKKSSLVAAKNEIKKEEPEIKKSEDKKAEDKTEEIKADKKEIVPEVKK